MECPKCEREIDDNKEKCPYCNYDLVNSPNIEIKKKKIFEQWWFWVIVIIILISIGLNIDNQQISTDEIQASTDEIQEPLIEYRETKDYNGTYKFLLSDNNEHGYIFNAYGVITIKNKECRIKYTRSNTADTIELKGTCGLNDDDMSIFYFTIYTDNNVGLYTYKCNKTEKDLRCELKSDFNLVGCSMNKELDLIYVNNTQDIGSIFYEIEKQEKEKQEKEAEEEKIRKEKEAEEEKIKKEKEEQDFKASCKNYTFEQIARNPENFKGTNVKLTGEVVQALYNSSSVDLRINITKNGTYTTYYTDTIYAIYDFKKGEDKILENDIVTIYGIAQGDYSYISTIGSKITLPLINVKHITIEK